MSWFFKGKAKGIGRYVSNPFKKSSAPLPQSDKTKLADEVQNAINKRNIESNKENKPKFRTKAFNYIKQIFIDYKDVGKDSLKYMSENPFKSLGYGLFMTSMVVFYKKNPNKIDYDDRRREFLNEMIMCGSTYSKRGEFYLNELNKLENAELLEYKSFIIFSLIMAKKFSDDDSTYEKQCVQLHYPSRYNIFNSVNYTLKFISRIVDIGFCGEWFFLNKRLKNYDVDENEWKTKQN